jgi:osmoprotectant transport system substrate-binding protein
VPGSDLAFNPPTKGNLLRLLTTHRRAATLSLPVVVALAALVAATVGSASGSRTDGKAALPGAGKPPIVMGAKSFTEEKVLGQLYMQALQAKGYKVTLNDSFPGVALINAALTSKKIQWYPEYTWEVITAVAHQQGKNIKNAQQAWDVANQIEKKQGFQLLKMTPFSDANAVAVNPEYAAKYHLKTIGDLKKIGKNASGVTYGDAPENRTLWTGLVGLKQAYGLTNIKFKGLDFGLLFSALAHHRVDAADVFLTAGQLTQYHFTILKDTKNIFGFQNVAPVVSPKLLAAEGPAFAQTLNAVSAKLTTPVMIQLNAAVDVKKLDPADVADKFLRANHLK